MQAKKEAPKSFVCSRCGTEHAFALYVFAHWNNELEHKCDCGARHSIQRGIAIALDDPEAANGVGEATGAALCDRSPRP